MVLSDLSSGVITKWQTVVIPKGESKLTWFLTALQLVSGGQARKKAHIIFLCLPLVSTRNIHAECEEDGGTAAAAGTGFSNWQWKRDGDVGG